MLIVPPTVGMLLLELDPPLCRSCRKPVRNCCSEDVAEVVVEAAVPAVALAVPVVLVLALAVPLVVPPKSPISFTKAALSLSSV